MENGGDGACVCVLYEFDLRPGCIAWLEAVEVVVDFELVDVCGLFVGRGVVRAEVGRPEGRAGVLEGGREVERDVGRAMVVEF